MPTGSLGAVGHLRSVATGDRLDWTDGGWEEVLWNRSCVETLGCDQKSGS